MFQPLDTWPKNRRWFIATGGGMVIVMVILHQGYFALRMLRLGMVMDKRWTRIIGLHSTQSHMTIQMKNRLCFCLVVTGTMLLTTGCDPTYERQNCPSYVVCYVGLDEIKLSVAPDVSSCILINHGKDTHFRVFHLNSEGENKETYDNLCRKHNDLKYNQYRTFARGLEYDSVTYNDCDFTSITIISDKDFDDTHPAGSNLADVVRFLSWSPRRFIESGYSAYYHYDSKSLSEAFASIMPIYFDERWFQKGSEATCYPVDKLVRDLQVEDLALLGHDAPGQIGLLFFEKQPTEKGSHTITVTMTTDSGKALSSAVSVTF